MKITPAHPVAYCTHIFTNTRRQLGKAEQRNFFFFLNKLKFKSLKFYLAVLLLYRYFLCTAI